MAALGIASLKASPVVWYFMHLNHSDSLPRLFWVAGLPWLVILLGIAMSDYATRNWMPPPQGWPEVSASKLEGHDTASPSQFSARGGMR